MTATSDTNRNVIRPTNATRYPTADPVIAGERRRSRKTPAFTMVLEWSKADVGEGAYIAPISQDENGICALLVMPAKASRICASAGIWCSGSDFIPPLY